VTGARPIAEEARFQRGRAETRVRKPQRKFPFRLRHAAGLLAGAALLFFAAYRIYAFVITWPRLEVRSVRAVCPDERIGALAEQAVASRSWGNLLLLDMSLVREQVQALPWVKDARIRKVFPSGLAVDVVPRRAAALVERDGMVLVDEEGFAIEASSREARPELPVFIDQDRFASDGQAKLKAALACWRDLGPDVRALVETIDVSAPADIVLLFRGSPTRVRLGSAEHGRRAADYLASRDRWERDFGPLESVLLGLSDRVVLRPRTAQDAAGPAAEGE
jgi:cell division septal protein FtsQ